MRAPTTGGGLCGAALTLLARAVWADHAGAGTRSSGGGGGLAWLFIVGFLVLLGMVAWAVLAPAREEPDDESPES